MSRGMRSTCPNRRHLAVLTSYFVLYSICMVMLCDIMMYSVLKLYACNIDWFVLF